MPIHVLPDIVSSKIAAGEVIERPASVVKELVENALDAGATQIAVEIRGGGTELVRVVDNGSGLRADELKLAFHRFATSKIATADDLWSVTSLGFRGEALASIAAVSDVTLVSKTPDSTAGAFIALKGGVVAGKGPRGCAGGTTITVERLFYNVPARLKFLKTVSTEAAHIGNLVSQYALAYPHCRFTLLSDGRRMFQSPGSGSLLDVILKVYGLSVAEAMVAVASEPDEREQVSGYVSKPSVHRSNRNGHSFFVNHRWVQSRALGFALEAAYLGLLPDGRHPIAVIDIVLPPAEVDVNVHPTKAEVRLLREREVFGMVQKAVHQAVRDFIVPPIVNYRAMRPLAEVPVPPPGPMFGAPPLEVAALPLTRPALETTPVSDRTLPIMRVLGQVMDNTFIVAEGPDGMYLIDQHRAHERLLYERLHEERAEAKVESQGLLEPLLLRLTPRDYGLLAAKLDGLAQLGLAIEPFGDHTYRVTAVPSALAKNDIEATLRQVVEEVIEDREPGDWRERALASLACHGAIKAGRTLTSEEMRKLVRKLEVATFPMTCPHGDPIIVHLSQAHLERQFGRR